MTCAHKMIYKKNEVRGYRVNIQKKNVFLYTVHNLFENEKQTKNNL